MDSIKRLQILGTVVGNVVINGVGTRFVKGDGFGARCRIRNQNVYAAVAVEKSSYNALACMLFFDFRSFRWRLAIDEFHTVALLSEVCANEFQGIYKVRP